MSRPTHYVFTNGMSQDEHDRVCDKQTTLVAKRIVERQRGTPKMTLVEAIKWLAGCTEQIDLDASHARVAANLEYIRDAAQ